MRNQITNSECSNLARYFEIQRHRDMHERRIKNVQPTLRATRDVANRSCSHIKKQPLAQFNRIVTIDIENKALLKKLTDKSPSRIGKQKPYKIVKNNRKKNLEEYQQRLDNQGLLKRIRQAKSSYQNVRYASQRKITESYINTISKYGYKNLAPNKTIMVPFYKCNGSKTTKPDTAPENCLQKQNRGHQTTHLDQVTEIQNKVPTDTIISIQTKQWFHPEHKPTKITYIIWQSKVTIQLDIQKEDSMSLQITKNTFTQYFNEKVQKIHKAIKYHKENDCYEIDLPTKGKAQC